MKEEYTMDFHYSEDKIWLTDEKGITIAEIDFPKNGDGERTITHTFVDDSLRGQGVAGKLVRAAVEQIRGAGEKTKVTCSYAAAWLQRHREYDDLLIR
ncbi:GNAT family N-acetyltransferase [uncultured Megasphaera sp.]|uniref:GNAT family N-acetyltransferase n=1 Tax=uncultured Megasphaera sp. TaxID=165188 RepID=UPI00228631F0|nr:GNAT family N-acetyltransferase [uncultured Megasphaera sp.]